MNDLEICKRIAEIEGLDFYLLESGGDTYPLIKVWHDSVLKDKCVPKKFFEPRDYDPLTDDALCFKLMNKHKVSIDHEDGMCGVLTKVSQTNHWEYLGNICYDKDVTINKAICLAIIEAHKDD